MAVYFVRSVVDGTPIQVTKEQYRALMELREKCRNISGIPKENLVACTNLRKSIRVVTYFLGFLDRWNPVEEPSPPVYRTEAFLFRASSTSNIQDNRKRLARLNRYRHVKPSPRSSGNSWFYSTYEQARTGHIAACREISRDDDFYDTLHLELAEVRKGRKPVSPTAQELTAALASFAGQTSGVTTIDAPHPVLWGVSYGEPTHWSEAMNNRLVLTLSDFNEIEIRGFPQPLTPRPEENNPQ